MTDAVPQFLDPAFASTLPRPAGLRVGDYPQQANAGAFRYWTIGISDRAIRAPFGDTVGTPLHYEYDLCPSNLLGVACHGDPEHPDDRSVIQAAQDSPPQVGRVFTTLFWCDWLHGDGTTSFNRNLVTKTANAYLGIQTRAGTDRPVLAVSALNPAVGSTFLASITNLTLSAPGNATQAGLDCPLLREDGSAASPLPLSIPCWIGRWGFRGIAGQVLAAGATTQSFGYFLKVKPAGLPFIENAPALKIEFSAQTAEFGCEAYAALTYTMVLLDGPTTYVQPDTTQAIPYPCKDYGQRLWKTREQTAFIQVFLTPLGDAWQAVVEVHQVLMNRSGSGGRYVVYGNFVPAFYVEKGTLAQTHPLDVVSATPIAFGSTTTISRNLFQGEATLTVEIAVGSTGTVTRCEARITRSVLVGNSGPGWHDTFHMQ
jgi:hypothetical protein